MRRIAQAALPAGILEVVEEGVRIHTPIIGMALRGAHRGRRIGGHMATLTTIQGKTAQKIYPIDEGLTIGRGPHNGIALPTTRGCSRDHAKLWRLSPGKYAVADLESTNGTLVNGETAHRVDLEDGDEIRIGDATFRFDLDDDEKPKTVARETSTERDDFAAVLRGDKERSDKPVAASLEGQAALQIKSRLLQYSKTEDKGSQLGWDLGQAAGATKWLLIGAALAICAGLFYVVMNVFKG
jgi:pSer/pThr/pTyr-binding forkhead associated (FHA) protein